jgi:hypothetical protein
VIDDLDSDARLVGVALLAEDPVALLALAGCWLMTVPAARLARPGLAANPDGFWVLQTHEEEAAWSRAVERALNLHRQTRQGDEEKEEPAWILSRPSL